MSQFSGPQGTPGPKGSSKNKGVMRRRRLTKREQAEDRQKRDIPASSRKAFRRRHKVATRPQGPPDSTYDHTQPNAYKYGNEG